MGLFNKVRKRGIFIAGLPSLVVATSAVPSANAAIRPKHPEKQKLSQYLVQMTRITVLGMK